MTEIYPRAQLVDATVLLQEADLVASLQKELASAKAATIREAAKAAKLSAAAAVVTDGNHHNACARRRSIGMEPCTTEIHRTLSMRAFPRSASSA